MEQGYLSFPLTVYIAQSVQQKTLIFHEFVDTVQRHSPCGVVFTTYILRHYACCQPFILKLTKMFNHKTEASNYKRQNKSYQKYNSMLCFMLFFSFRCCFATVYNFPPLPLKYTQLLLSNLDTNISYWLVPTGPFRVIFHCNTNNKEKTRLYTEG